MLGSGWMAAADVIGPGPSRRVSVSYGGAGGAPVVSASARIVVTPEISLSIAQRDLIAVFASQMALFVESEELRQAGERRPRP